MYACSLVVPAFCLLFWCVVVSLWLFFTVLTLYLLYVHYTCAFMLTSRWTAKWTLRRAILTDYHKTKHFRWWNVFDDMCRMDSWSVRSWFDV